jgi:hypothetical protein
LIHVYHFSMQTLLETTYQSKKHTFLIYVTGVFSQCNLKQLNWCLALLMTIAYLEHFSKLYQNKTLKTIFLIFTKIEYYELWSCVSQTATFKRKKVWYDPMCFIVVCLSVCLSVSPSVIIKFALVHKLHMHALCIFHSILIRTYVLKQTYIDLHLPKGVLTN